MATIITHKNNIPHFGKHPLVKAVMNTTFSALVFQVLSEKKPTALELELFDLLLKLSLDHGTDAPSAKSTTEAARQGASISEAVGEGIQTICESHGGAQEPLMRIFYDIASGKTNAKNTVEKLLSDKKRVPGFGHRIYKKDPRTELILETMEKLKFPKKYIILSNEIERELKHAFPQKTLPLNVDGAIAIALCTLKWKPEWSQAIFITARSAGLCGQYINHRTG